jgi:hypothetical protein
MATKTTKTFLESRTIWLNLAKVAVGLLLVLFGYDAMGGQVVADVFDPMGFAVIGEALVSIALRVDTFKKIK